MKISKEQAKSVASVLVSEMDAIRAYIEANRINYEKWLAIENANRQHEILQPKRRRTSKKKVKA